MSATTLDLDALADRTTSALAHRFPDALVTDVVQLVGGASSLTYAAALHAAGDDRRIVVKVAPPGLEPVRNRDVLRQARVLELLGGVPAVAVPEVLGTDAGSPIEVPPLFVMAYVEGESYEPQLTPTPTRTSADDIAARAFTAARMAAALHSVPADDLRLAGERVTDLEAEVGRWARAFSSVDDDLRPGADNVRDALLARLPGPLPPSVLHGDWRLGNMQCSGPSIGAVIDWEIWSLGDRRLDLAWFLLLVDPAHPSRVRADTGLPAPVELVAAYEAAAGQTVADLGWFNALVRYKQAAASALIIKNNRKRPQPGVDIERMLAGLPLLLEWAGDLLA